MMAGMSSDLEVLKDIPGYKAILKTVLKSQIQLLIEQLSDHTGEETIVLTASVHDGTLSHLGSITGKGFLDGRDEIKSQFLAFCLKSHHRRKSSEARSSPYQRPQSGGQGDRLKPSQGHIHKRARLQPVSLQRAGNSENTGNSFTPPDIHRAPSQSFNGQDNSSSINVKLESSEQSVSCADNTDYAASSVSFPSSLQLSHTQTSVDQATSDNSEIHNDEDLTEQTSENDDSAATSIKIEPITENEMELEITGVEPGKSSVSSDSWGQGQLPGSSGVGEGVPTEAGDQSGYIAGLFLNQETQEITRDDMGNLYFHRRLSDLDPTKGQTPRTFKSNVHQVQLPSNTTRGLHVNKEFRNMGNVSNTVTLEQDSLSEYKDLEKMAAEELAKGKSSQCSVCQKWFYKSSDLKRHMMIHTGEKPFGCQICFKAFNRKSTLKIHMMVHLKDGQIEDLPII